MKDLTLSPVKIDEPVELLSSQLFVSSIREEIADTANEQANPPEQSSALSDLVSSVFIVLFISSLLQFIDHKN